MPRMTKEEKELRRWIRDASVSLHSDRPEGYALVRALVRSVREECAKVVEREQPKRADIECFVDKWALIAHLAAAIRGGKR